MIMHLRRNSVSPRLLPPTVYEVQGGKPPCKPPAWCVLVSLYACTRSARGLWGGATPQAIESAHKKLMREEDEVQKAVEEADRKELLDVLIEVKVLVVPGVESIVAEYGMVSGVLDLAVNWLLACLQSLRRGAHYDGDAAARISDGQGGVPCAAEPKSAHTQEGDRVWRNGCGFVGCIFLGIFFCCLFDGCSKQDDDQPLDKESERKVHIGQHMDKEPERQAPAVFDEKARIQLLENADIVTRANESQKLMSCARLVYNHLTRRPASEGVLVFCEWYVSWHGIRS